MTLDATMDTLDAGLEPGVAPGAADPTTAPTSATAVAVPGRAGDHLRSVTRRIAPVWELDHFVAVNPYLGLSDLAFPDAARLLADLAGARSTLDADFYLEALADGRLHRGELAAALARSPHHDEQVEDFLARVRTTDAVQVQPAVRTFAEVAAEHTGTDWARFGRERLSSWAASHFDRGQALWHRHDHAGAFESWRWEASVDRSADVLGAARLRAVVAQLPPDHEQAAAWALSELGVPEDAAERYLHALVLRLGGWAAHAARFAWDARLAGTVDDTPEQLLAALVCWEAALHRAIGTPELDRRWRSALAEGANGGSAAAPALADLLVLQDAFDRSAQADLVATLGRAGGTPAATGTPRAQAVFCIDVRSEVFRRHLEAVAPDVATIGFAGFFGVPVEFRPLGHDRGVAQCPVLLTPSHVVTETTADPAELGEALARRSVSHQVGRAWKWFKMGAISCFSFVGPVGLAYLPKLLRDEFGRARPVAPPATEGLPRRLGASLRPTPEVLADGSGIPAEDRVALAEGALRAMSLTSGFAPIVLVVGHGSSTVNNPYATGLDCGACGGHTGEVNARVTAELLNDPEVRAGLAGRGIEIPDGTRFVAALHDTTCDEVTCFDVGDLSGSALEALDRLRADLAEAGSRTRAERARRFGSLGADLDASVAARSTDWAQVRPEWGLAGCHSFVAAPRARTAGADLQGRTFLHSYDWRADDGFGVLELIMTAPMVVASWINLQYYASTVENRLFGSGNKTLHNVVGRLGVLEGNGGDLRTGLPWQSVHDGVRHQHEPVRLNVVIEAPRDAMTDVLERHDDVRALLDNGWINLFAMDDRGVVSHRYVGRGTWEAVEAGRI